MPTTEVQGVLDRDGLGSLAHDGATFAYRVQGSGAPVVLIQGVGLHGDGWAPQVDVLSEAFACLSFDHRGMGASQSTAGAVTVERLADAVEALMDAQGWDTAHLVGPRSAPWSRSRWSQRRRGHAAWRSCAASCVVATRRA